MPTEHETRFLNRAVPALNRLHGVTIVLRRDGVDSVPFVARRRDIEHEAMGQNLGLEIKVTMRDYTIPASITIGTAVITPRAGDQLIDDGDCYQIQPPDSSRPAMMKLPGNLQILCHTRLLVGYDVNKLRK